MSINWIVNFRQILDRVFDKDENRLRVIGADLVPGVDYDEVDVTYPSATSEVYTFKLSTSTVRVVTLTFSDATKENLTNVSYA